MDEGAHAYEAVASDDYGNATQSGALIVTVDRTAPVTTITSGPDDGTEVGEPPVFGFRSTEPGKTACSLDGGAYATCTSPYTAAGGSGSHSVALRSTDVAGNVETGGPQRSWVVVMRWTFSGFRSPVDNLPTVNTTKAGSAIPVKFGLGGNRGLNIFAAGSPTTVRTDCVTNAALAEVEQTVTAGQSSLTYDAGADQYVYVWKTDRGWAGQCRELRMTLADGSVHRAAFKFR